MIAGRFCQWTIEADLSKPGRWLVQLRENKHGDAPRLMTTTKLADSKNAAKTESYSRIRRLKASDQFTQHDMWAEVLEADAAAASEGRLTVLHVVSGIRVLLLGAPTNKALEELLPQVMTLRLQPSFPQALCYLVEVDPAVGNRIAIARALLRATDSIADIESTPDLAFRSSRELFSDTTLGFEAYLDPLFTCLAPFVWGFSVGRPGALLVFMFGTLQLGRASRATALLDHHLPTGQSAPIRNPSGDVGAGAQAVALDWWVNRLGALFSTTADPGNYLESGEVSIARMVERMLTLEQYFRHCQSIAIHGNDTHVRRLIMFNALDMLEGLNPKLAWKQLTQLQRAQATLEDLELALPADAKDLLLPRARAAVAALREVASGFYIPSQVKDGNLHLKLRSGAVEKLDLSSAVSAWLRVIRNSHHGFDKRPSERERALMAAHDGSIPGELPDLAWLYLLQLLAHPELLRVGKRSSA
jgi:hypothetical protein